MTIIAVDGMPLVNKCTNSYHRENCNVICPQKWCVHTKTNELSVGLAWVTCLSMGAFTILPMVTIGTFIYQWHTINTNDCHWYFLLVTNSADKPVKLELPTRAFHKTKWWPQVLKEEFEDTNSILFLYSHCFVYPASIYGFWLPLW
jgi:hypothetical protein